MKKFSKKGVLLFAAAMALCAFAMPSMASASTWGSVPSEHTLTSTAAGPVGFSADALGTTSDCARTGFTVDVVSSAVVEITSASFVGCTATGPAASVGFCSATSTATGLPWTATAVSTSNIQIHGVNIDVAFENHPGSTACVGAGLTLRITGTLTGAKWTGNGAGQHSIELLGATGLVSHSAVGNNVPITTTGTVTDTQHTLTVTN
jgi:hypothetical protein